MGNNPSQQAAALTTAISQNVVDALQSNSTSQSFNQELINDCSGFRPQDNCIKDVSDLCKTNNLGSDQCADLARFLCTCSTTNVNMKQIIVVSEKATQDADIKSDIQNSVSSTLSQAAKDSGAAQEAAAASSSVVVAFDRIRQTIYDNISASQKIGNIGGQVAGITMDQSINIISDVLQKNTTATSAINTLATTITQSSVNTMNWIMYVGVIIIILFIVIFLILMLSKSKDLKEFFYKILPVLIWLLLSVITTIILVLAKPHFVCYQNAQTKEYEVDKFTLSMYLIIFYIVYGIIIIAILKIKQQKQQKLNPNSDTNTYSKSDSEPNSKSNSNSNKDLFE